MGFEIVRVALSGKHRPVLQFMIDRVDGQNITIDDCVSVSHTVSAILDVEDPIEGAYKLEVTSPGLDRPLTKPSHFTRFTGQTIKLETTLPLEGRRRFQGLLQSAHADSITIEAVNESGETTLFTIDYPLILKAKLHPEAGCNTSKAT